MVSDAVAAGWQRPHGRSISFEFKAHAWASETGSSVHSIIKVVNRGVQFQALCPLELHGWGFKTHWFSKGHFNKQAKLSGLAWCYHYHAGYLYITFGKHLVKLSTLETTDGSSPMSSRAPPITPKGLSWPNARVVSASPRVGFRSVFNAVCLKSCLLFPANTRRCGLQSCRESFHSAPNKSMSTPKIDLLLPWKEHDLSCSPLSKSSSCMMQGPQITPVNLRNRPHLCQSVLQFL